MPPPVVNEQFVDLPWPLNGLELVGEFGSQRQGTAIQGANVRTNEGLLERQRGGSRPGLAKYLPDLVMDDTATVIQHLNIIVDPTTDFLLTDDDTGDTIDDPSTNNHKTRNPAPARKVRKGGSGRQPNIKKKLPKLPPSITSVSPNTGSRLGGDTVTISGLNLKNLVGSLASTVTFGKVAGTVVSNNGITMVVTSPPGATGTTVDIRVRVPSNGGQYGGRTPIVSGDQFTYFLVMDMNFSLVLGLVRSDAAFVLSPSVTAFTTTLSVTGVTINLVTYSVRATVSLNVAAQLVTVDFFCTSANVLTNGVAGSHLDINPDNGQIFPVPGPLGAQVSSQWHSSVDGLEVSRLIAGIQILP